jgi:hypothetical protein
LSSFTAAKFEPVILPNGKQKTREGRKVFRVLGADGDGMRFHVGFPGSGISVHVPEGFETDGPSIPTLQSEGLAAALGLITWVVPQSARNRAMKASAVHDLLCEDPRFERAAADGEYWVAMSAEGTPRFWRWVFFRAVTLNKSKERHNHHIKFGDE